MIGTLWAMLAGVVFGVFQAFNRRAGRGFDAYWSTFILLIISSVILALVSVLTDDLSLLVRSSAWAIVNFGLAGFILGILAFGEVLSIPVSAGIALVVGGVYLVSNG